MHEGVPAPHPRVCEARARILLTGDQTLIRTALRLLISAGGMTIAGECGNDPGAIRFAMDGVDLVVMDLDLDLHLIRPGKLGPLLGATKGCPLLIVTGAGDGRGITAALQHGALGVVLKNRPADVLLRAIRAVLAGEVWLERSMVTSFFRAEKTESRDPCVVPERLTRRESEVVELISLGLPNKKIAERLSITENTVRHHLTSIFDKLEVTNRVELMRYTWNAAPGGQQAV